MNMKRFAPARGALYLLLPLVLLAALPATPVAAQTNRTNEQQSGLTPRQAAQQAKAQHGGKVLKVTPQGRGYQVRLLLKSGRVKTVWIKG